VWKGGIRTSCRKFDAFGDWYLVRNPQLVKRIFTGNDREAADLYYYEVDRKHFEADKPAALVKPPSGKPGKQG
jgi:hypothetical protein